MSGFVGLLACIIWVHEVRAVEPGVTLRGPVTFTNVCQGGRWRLRYSNDADGVPGDLLIECATPGGGFRRYVTVRGLTKHCTNVRAVSDGRGGAIINCEGFKP